MVDKFNSIINEEISGIDKIINPDGAINFNSFAIKDSLNPDIFDNDELKQKIKKALLKILDSIIEDSVLLKKKDIKDAVIVGSIVSFHYSSYSDIDFHIIVDMKKLHGDTELIKTFLDDERRLWNIYHHVEIEGYEVEIYFQDINEKNVSNGCYSVLNDKWVKYPDKETYTIDKDKLSKRAINLIENIEILKDSETPDLKYAQKLWDKVIKGRKEDITKNGEFSEGNILFKILRRTGHIEILKNIIDSEKDKELSIEESKNINSKKKINSNTNMKLNIKKFNNSLMESIRDYCTTNNTKEISKHTIMHLVESCLEDECDEISEDKEELAVIHITATGKNKAECSQNAYEKLKKYLHDMKMEKPKIAAMKYTEVKEKDGIMNIKLEAQIEGITGDDIYIDEHDELKECIKKTIKECDKVQNEEEINENDLEDTKSVVTDRKQHGSEKDIESLVEKYVALANKYFDECSGGFAAKASYVPGYSTEIKYSIRTPKMFLFGVLPLPESDDTDILCKVDTIIGKQNPTYEYLNDLLKNADYRISSEMFNQVFKDVFREYKDEEDAECIDRGKDKLLTIYNYLQYKK